MLGLLLMFSRYREPWDWWNGVAVGWANETMYATSSFCEPGDCVLGESCSTCCFTALAAARVENCMYTTPLDLPLGLCSSKTTCSTWSSQPQSTAQPRTISSLVHQSRLRMYRQLLSRASRLSIESLDLVGLVCAGTDGTDLGARSGFSWLSSVHPEEFPEKTDDDEPESVPDEFEFPDRLPDEFPDELPPLPAEFSDPTDLEEPSEDSPPELAELDRRVGLLTSSPKPLSSSSTSTRGSDMVAFVSRVLEAKKRKNIESRAMVARERN